MSKGPRRIWRADHGPQPVASSMAKVLGRLGAPASLETMDLVFARWPEVVGEDLVEHVRPVRIHGATLVIGAEHPAWVTRCRMEAERIVAAVRALGDTSIERVDVVLERP